MLHFLEDWFFVPLHTLLQESPPVCIVCSVCSESFQTKALLRTHLKVHIEPIVCRICGKAQTDKARLARHMLVHTKEKNYTCSYCARTFTHNCNRKIHERTHTGEKPYKCTLCSFKSSQLSNMKCHMRLKHKTALPDHFSLSLDSDESICKICSRVFSSNISLKLHTSICQVNEVECSLCNRKFRGSFNLERHMQSHIKELDRQHWDNSTLQNEANAKPACDMRYKLTDDFTRY